MCVCVRRINTQSIRLSVSQSGGYNYVQSEIYAFHHINSQTASQPHPQPQHIWNHQFNFCSTNYRGRNHQDLRETNIILCGKNSPRNMACIYAVEKWKYVRMMICRKIVFYFSETYSFSVFEEKSKTSLQTTKLAYLFPFLGKHVQTDGNENIR